MSDNYRPFSLANAILGNDPAPEPEPASQPSLFESFGDLGNLRELSDAIYRRASPEFIAALPDVISVMGRAQMEQGQFPFNLDKSPAFQRRQASASLGSFAQDFPTDLDQGNRAFNLGKSGDFQQVQIAQAMGSSAPDLPPGLPTPQPPPPSTKTDYSCFLVDPMPIIKPAADRFLGGNAPAKSPVEVGVCVDDRCNTYVGGRLATQKRPISVQQAESPDDVAGFHGDVGVPGFKAQITPSGAIKGPSPSPNSVAPGGSLSYLYRLPEWLNPLSLLPGSCSPFSSKP
jgi:hypothetical protein